MPHPTPEQRFWSHTDRSNPQGCWLWMGRKDRLGYGSFRINNKIVSAHRYAHALLIGPIDEGLQVDHLCSVASCVNPAHLEAVTPKVNTLRSMAPSAINARKIVCPQGHPYDEDNTRVDRKGHRFCRECQVLNAIRARHARWEREGHPFVPVVQP